MAKLKQEVIWQPQPGPQTRLVTCPVFEVFFGGARGGGKTDASIGDWLQHSNQYGVHAIGLFIRRTLTQLAEVIARTKYLFPKIGAKYNEKKAEWVMPNGARLKFAYLERDADASNYQGHNYTRVYIEEAGDFPFIDPINKLKGTLRSAVGVPCGMRLTGNPGGPGHGWLKHRYIEPCRTGYKVITEVEEIEIDGEMKRVELSRVFIPSKVQDNKLLLRNNPAYLLQLKQTGSEQLVKAWLDGDWDAVEGAFFSEFDANKHILDSDIIQYIPKKVMRFRSFDWGSARPFSVGWWVYSDGSFGFPKGALIRYKEWYGAKGPNIGLNMTAREVAEGIKLRQKAEIIKYGVADPAIFKQDGGPSIGQTMAKFGVAWKKADNQRIAGWEQVRIRLKGVDGVPLIYFTENCVDTISILPSLQHDQNNYEDLDTKQEDHIADDIRYACMSNPYHVRNIQTQYRNRDGTDYFNCTMNEIVDNLKRKRLQKENWE